MVVTGPRVRHRNRSTAVGTLLPCSPTSAHRPPRAQFVVAHPDDKTFGCGSECHAAGLGWGDHGAVRGGEAGEPAPGSPQWPRPLAEQRAEANCSRPHQLLGSPGTSSTRAWTASRRLVAVRGRPRRGPDAVRTVTMTRRVVVSPDAAGTATDHRRMRDAAVTVAAERGVQAYLRRPRSLMDRVGRPHDQPGRTWRHLQYADWGPDDQVSLTLDSAAHLAVRERAIALHASQTSPFGAPRRPAARPSPSTTWCAPEQPGIGPGGSVEVGSIGRVECQASSPGWRRITSRQSRSGRAGRRRRPGRNDVPAALSISPTSCSAPQPTYPAKIRRPSRLPLEQLERVRRGRPGRVRPDRPGSRGDVVPGSHRRAARAPWVLTGPTLEDSGGHQPSQPSRGSATGTRGTVEHDPERALVVDVEGRHHGVGRLGSAGQASPPGACPPAPGSWLHHGPGGTVVVRGGTRVVSGRTTARSRCGWKRWRPLAGEGAPTPDVRRGATGQAAASAALRRRAARSAGCGARSARAPGGGRPGTARWRRRPHGGGVDAPGPAIMASRILSLAADFSIASAIGVGGLARWWSTIARTPGLVGGRARRPRRRPRGPSAGASARARCDRPGGVPAAQLGHRAAPVVAERLGDAVDVRRQQAVAALVRHGDHVAGGSLRGRDVQVVGGVPSGDARRKYVPTVRRRTRYANASR